MSTQTTQTAFALKIQTTNSLTQSFVGNDPHEWLTSEYAEVKTWKTEAGARRWLASRPGIKGQVVTVRIGRRTGKPCGVIGG